MESERGEQKEIKKIEARLRLCRYSGGKKVYCFEEGGKMRVMNYASVTNNIPVVRFQ